MTHLDDRVRNHYRALQLDSQVLASISNTPNSKSRFRFPAMSWPTWGAATVFASLLVASLAMGVHEFGSRSERTARTLNEAAMNHSTRLQFEFETSSLAQVDASMNQLPFEVVLPVKFNQEYELLGARYCTLNGELAAHVKFLNQRSDKQVSLFMTRAVEDLKKIKTTTDNIDGVNVTLWNESGLFYAMASR